MLPFINRLTTAVFDGWSWIVQAFPPVIQICVLALPVTAFALLIFRLVSNQDAIRDAKDKIKAHLLELRLFQDDLAVAVRTQGQIFRYSFVYLRAALLPAAVMFIPVLLIIFQVEARYAWRSLQPGGSAILTATFDDEIAVDELQVNLSLPAQLVQETPALRITETNQILWRIRAIEPGVYLVKGAIGTQEFERRIVAGVPDVSLSPAVHRSTDLYTLTAPTEPALESNVGVAAIELAYPRARPGFAGLSSASWILFRRFAGVWGSAQGIISGDVLIRQQLNFPHFRRFTNFFKLAGLDIVDVAINGNMTRDQRMRADTLDVLNNALDVIGNRQPVDIIAFA